MEFKAYGLESVTGVVSNLPQSKLKQLFPGVSEKTLMSVTRGSQVVVLISIYHSSWQPKPLTQAVGGGDLWLYENRFGRCVGGRHPEVYEGTRRSDQIFTVNVNHARVSKVSGNSSSSHELEFCPERAVVAYENSRSNTLSPLSHHINTIPSQTVIEEIDVPFSPSVTDTLTSQQQQPQQQPQQPQQQQSQQQQSQQQPQQQQPHQQQHTDVVENESLQSSDIAHEESFSSLEPDVTLHSSAPSDSVISVSADP